ncbi:MAG: restriction endonuclease subunit S [Acidithiobacillus sp.]
MAARTISPSGRNDKAELERLDDEALARLVKERENEPTIQVGVEDFSDPGDASDAGGLQAQETRGEYRVGTDPVGWVPPAGDKRPEAVTHHGTRWTPTVLGELADFEMGQAPLGNECNKEGKGTVFVKAGEFADLYPDEIEWTTKPLKYGRKGDVFICVVGATAGKLNLGIDCAIGRSIAAIRPREGVDTKFIYYQLMPWVLKLRAASAGSAQGVISKAQLKEIPFKIVGIDQQKRIVAEIEKQFSLLDEAVANLKRVKANLLRYKAAVFKAAVEGRLVETEAALARREGRTYETGAKLLQRILETRRSQWQGKGKYKEPAAPDTTDLPELPEGWVWARLDAIAALKGGITVDSKRKDLTARSVPYLRVANVQRGYIDLAEVKYIEAPESEIKALRLLRGDILFNEGGDRDKLGRGWIWEDQLADCIHQNHVFRARLYLDQLSPKLVSWWGNSFGKDYFAREGKQTTNLASINLTKLSAFPVPLPPAAEQQEIVAEVDRRLSLIHEVEAQVDANLRRVERLRQSILAQAFSGRLKLSEESVGEVA